MPDISYQADLSEAAVAEQGEDVFEGAKQRSPAFPYIPLDAAIGRIKLIYSKVRDTPQPREQIAKAYGKPLKSSATQQTIATLLQYGLLENIIVNGEKRLRVSPMARTIIHPNAPQNEIKANLQKAALAPDIFNELHNQFEDSEQLSDDVLLYYLTHDRGSAQGSVYTDGGARDVLRNYRATIAFAGVAESDSTDQTNNSVDEWEAADPVVQHRKVAQESAMSEPRTPPPPVASAPATSLPPGSREDKCNIPEGVVTLTFPEEFSQASFEDIEAWLDFQKNRLKRWVKAN